ncbi:MAG: hypothetical protein JWL98_956 [Xanthomonadaceae bacterium]|nr:hypothetical protein [Xanthomonadaceae bacterium]
MARPAAQRSLPGKSLDDGASKTGGRNYDEDIEGDVMRS